MSGYNAGDLVYYPATVAARVYMSLTNANTTAPSLVAPTWDATIIYNPGDFVTSSSVVYASIWPAGDNLNNIPVSSPLYWEALPTWVIGTTYNLNDEVIYNDVIYKSLQAVNVGNQVDSSPTWWQVLQGDLALGNWLLLDATLAEIINPAALYPGQSVFPLPNGFLREAPQDPKAGIASIMGAPANATANDWLYEGPWIISATGSMIGPFRFIADITDAAQFDTMFVEGLAARIAQEVCEPLTQSTAKLDAIQKAYRTVMGEARLVNGIETGAAEPPLDDYLATRM